MMETGRNEELTSLDSLAEMMSFWYIEGPFSRQ